jgi:hypothetical protein
MINLGGEITTEMWKGSRQCMSAMQGGNLLHRTSLFQFMLSSSPPQRSWTRRRANCGQNTTSVAYLTQSPNVGKEVNHTYVFRPNVVPTSVRSRSPTRRRVGRAPPLARLSLLGWQPRIGFDPVGAGSAEPGLRGSDGGRFGLTGLHVQPRLAVGDVSARQAMNLLVTKNQLLRPVAPAARGR